MSRVRVLTLNCWGLFIFKHAAVRIEHIAKELAKGDYDIIVLQEVWHESYYELIKTHVCKVLPFSHYFESGVIGSGLCMFSAWPIIDLLQYRYPINGHFYAIKEGDWLAGKSAGLCTVHHPKRELKVYLTHLHAAYKHNSYEHLRTFQMWHLTQFIRHTSSPRDAVLVCGDLNHHEHEVGYTMLTRSCRLSDAWLVAGDKKESGLTSSTPDNPYTQHSSQPERIDYILCSNAVEALECCTAMSRIPNTSMHFSDHKGVAAVVLLKDQANASVLQPSLPISVPKSAQSSLLLAQKLMQEGAARSGDRPSTQALLVLVLLVMVCLLPLAFGSLYHFYVSDFTSWSGKLVFAWQLVSTITLIAFVWNRLVCIRMEKRTYNSAAREIGVLLRSCTSDS